MPDIGRPTAARVAPQLVRADHVPDYVYEDSVTRWVLLCVRVMRHIAGKPRQDTC